MFSRAWPAKSRSLESQKPSSEPKPPPGIRPRSLASRSRCRLERRRHQRNDSGTCGGGDDLCGLRPTIGVRTHGRPTRRSARVSCPRRANRDRVRMQAVSVGMPIIRARRIAISEGANPSLRRGPWLRRLWSRCVIACSCCAGAGARAATSPGFTRLPRA